MHLGSIEIQNVFQGTDVLLCQEVSIKNNMDLVKNENIQLEKQLRCKVHISRVVNATCLVTFIKHDLEKYSKDFKEIADGRATCLVLENENYHYDIINVYGPARGTYDEYTNFCKDVFNFAERTNAVLMGDWNVLLDDSMCSKPINDQHKGRARRVQQWFENWIDAHNILKADLNFTYINNNYNYRSRLDRVYAKQVEIQKMFEYNITPVAFSDHDAVFITIKWGSRPRWGRGTWAMNT